MPAADIRDKVEEFIRKLAGTSHLEVMYGPDHRITIDAIGSLHLLLVSVLEELEELTIGIIGDEIAFEKKPFYDASVQIKGFIDHLKDLDLKKISFKRGISVQELKEFNHLLTTKTAVLGENGIEELFAEADIQNISIGDVGFRKVPEGGGGIDIEGVKDTYEEGMEYVETAAKDSKIKKDVNLQAARQIVNRLLSEITKHKNLLLIMSSTKSRDEKNLVRGMNVAVFTILQAEALGMDKQQLNAVGVAALLHNSGDMAVSKDPGNNGSPDMTEEKKHEITEKHIRAAKILLDTPGIDKMAAIAAFEEEVNFDGSGLPERLYGGEPLLISMMISISNYYDRMRARPEYKETGGVEKIYEEMLKLSGTKFHPDLLSNFFILVGKFPPGTLVELDTGEMGLVVQQSTLDLERPQVELLYSPDGTKIEKPKIVNLLEKDRKGKYRWSIKRSVAPGGKFEVPGKYS